MTEGRHEILLVDDEKSLLLGTKRLLTEEGYSVDAASCGRDGIELGTSKEYDIAVIDLKMPDFDGIKVLEEIKNVHPNTICFIATAFASYDTAIESTRKGAFGYIPKPFTPDELLYQIEHGCKQRRIILESERLKREREEKLLELADEQSRLNTIINSIDDGILVINKTGLVVYYNSSTLKYLELSELNIGDPALHVLPDEVLPAVAKILSEKSFIPKSYSFSLDLKTDHRISVQISCTPIKNYDGNVAGIVLVIRDITEARKIELIKSQFVSMVAHELKAPVAAVQGFLSILLNDTLRVTESKKSEYLRRSSERLASLTELVNDLLDISRMDAKTKQREIAETNILNITDECIDLFEAEIRKRNLHVKRDYASGVNLLNADASEIKRVVTNLLSNAIKYNRDAGEIAIAVNQSGNFIRYEIRDTGIGMRPPETEKLFSEFYRVKNERTRGIGGTGLGLSIVKRIVESYHGSIKVESEYLKGTVFIISLPINQK